MRIFGKKSFIATVVAILCFVTAFAGCGGEADVIVPDDVKAKNVVVGVIDDVSISNPVYFNIKGNEKMTENGKDFNAEFVLYGGIKLSADLKSYEIYDIDMFSVSSNILNGENVFYGDAGFYRGGKHYGRGKIYYEKVTTEGVKNDAEKDLSDENFKLKFVEDVNDIFKGIASPAQSESSEIKSLESAFEAVPAATGVLKGIAALADISVNGDVYTIDCLSTAIKILNYVKGITAVIDANPDITLGELYNNAAVQILAKPVLGSISAKDALTAMKTFTVITPETIKQQTGLVLPEPGDKNLNDYLAQIISECSFVFGKGESAVQVGVGTVKISDMFKGSTKVDPDGNANSDGGADSGAPADEWKNLTPIIDKAVAEVNDVLKVLKISLTIVNKKVTAVKINANYNEERREPVDDNPPVITKYNVDLVLECELLDAMPELYDVTKNLPETDQPQ